MARAPAILLLPALLVSAGTCLPVIWLVLRATDASLAELAEIVFRARNAMLLLNTLKLVVATLAIATAIALPLAWLLTRSDIGYRRVLSYLAVLPLAVPGYVMAYALIGLSGYYGFLRHWFGLSTPPLYGLWGAALALSFYTFPYIFLNLRAAFLGLDSALEETARSLGKSPWEVFRHVTLPQIWPALVSGWVIVALYVIGDFGAIALMRYEVFSYAIYTQYGGAFDRIYAAWLSLMLLAMTLAILWMQGRLTKRHRHARTGSGAARLARPVRLGRWRWLAWAGVATVSLVTLGLPLAVLAHWMRFGVALDWPALAEAAVGTALVAAPVATVTAGLALPVVLLSLRHGMGAAERLAYLGYATPPLSFALAMVFFSLGTIPVLYQSFTLLIFAYAISFLALSIGPIRLALLQIGTRQEEAARSLGASPARAFRRVVLPRLRKPVVAGGILVFVMVAKELPMAWILSPTGFRTMSMNVFSRTVEGMMAEAAPYALAIILFSGLFIGLILKHEGGERS